MSENKSDPCGEGEEVVSLFMQEVGRLLLSKVWMASHYYSQELSGRLGISYEQAEDKILARFCAELMGTAEES